MSQLIASAPTWAPAFRDLDERPDHHDKPARMSRVWGLLEALAYAGAFIDPSGVLAIQRLHRAQEEHDRANR